jgi:hypothetical protein
VRAEKTLNEFVEVFRELHMGVYNDIMNLKTKGYGPQTFGGRDDPPILGGTSGLQKPKAVRNTTTTTTSTGTLAKCYMCGRPGHLKASCNLSTHPDCNRENLPWHESEKGRAWKAFNRDTFLPQDPHKIAARAARATNVEVLVSGGRTQNHRSPPRDFRAGGRGRGQNRKKDRESPPKQTGMLSLLGVLDTINVKNHQRLTHFFSCSIIVSRPPTVGRSEPEIVQRARGALDTQANGIDLKSLKCLEQLVDIDSYKCRDCSQLPIFICSPIITPNTCISRTTGKIKITILLPSIHKEDELRVLNLTCMIADLDDRLADVVIGSDTIAKEGLLNSNRIRTSLESSTTDDTHRNRERRGATW